MRHLCDLFFDGLSEPELEDCRAVLVEKGSTFGLGMLSRMQNLSTLAAAVRYEWLLEMLREDRLVVHFQPVVSVADPSEVFAYECLLRGLDGRGALVSPKRMFEAARQAGLLSDLDRAARIKAVSEASRLELERRVFINFDPASIYDPVYCLESTMEVTKRSGLSPTQVVFEVTQSETFKNRKHLRNLLNFCRESGLLVALDDLGPSDGSLELLDALRPDFVKLDMGLLQDVDQAPCRAAIASKLLELTNDLGVAVVAEGVETEEQWWWLLAHDADFAQGCLFAELASHPLFPPPLTLQKPEQDAPVCAQPEHLILRR